jgi:N-acetylglucosaminylphosphatidylinositol deacetylase
MASRYGHSQGIDAASDSDEATPVPTVWTLRTVPVVRKYSGLLLDLPWTALRHVFSTRARAGRQSLLVIPWSGYRAARRAFAAHASQYVWDRHVYMLLSQYMMVNTLENVSL